MKWIGSRAAVWMLVLGLLAPVPAGAVTYEDSFDQCNYPKGLDLLVMRPISLMTIVAGAAVFIPLAPLAFLTVPNEVDTTYEMLIASPARFTFDRALGECTAVLRY